MIDYYSLTSSVVIYGLLPLAVVLPVVVIIISFRVNFQVQASFLLYVLLLGSLLTGFSGTLCSYRHISKDDVKALLMEKVIVKLQSLSRTILSTATTSIFIVKFLTKVRAKRETVNNAGIGFFILLIFTKFCSVTILPDVKFYSFNETGQKITFEMFELLESGVDIICLISTVIFVLITCNGDNIVYPMTGANEDQQPVTQPLHLPSFPVMTLIRLFLLACLQYQFMFASENLAKIIVEDLFVILHAFIVPLIIILTTREMRNQLFGIILARNNVVECDQELEMHHDNSKNIMSPLDDEFKNLSDSHRPDSAPTRPSSAAMTLPGTLPENSVRVPYKSNIRKHRSALETVVSAPRRRRVLRTNDKGKGGPLDRVMVSMVGEKTIPLEESDEEDASHCKTM